MRGRVLAIDAATGTAILRGERGDVSIPARAGWRPGDIVDAQGTVVGKCRLVGGTAEAMDVAFPDPTTETARISRARMTNLYARGKALASLRAFFAEYDFLEVETPLLVPSPGLEIHLDAVPAGGGYLITSPEYQMKRLLAAGFERIYQVCKCFRGNERGKHHVGEFTMLEWYRAFDDLDVIIRDTEELVSRVVRDLGGKSRIDVTPPWERMTVREAMRDWAGVTVRGDEPAAELRDAVRAVGIEIDDNAAWDDVFYAAFLARIEPVIQKLAKPLILEDWPAPLAALARRRPDDPLTVLRFEAYVGGIELANAFGELVDPVEQRVRFEEDLRVRRERGRGIYPIDEKLLAALAEGLPPSSGIALGFDRLVMIATGTDRIDDVLSFTPEEL